MGDSGGGVYLEVEAGIFGLGGGVRRRM